MIDDNKPDDFEELDNDEIETESGEPIEDNSGRRSSLPYQTPLLHKPTTSVNFNFPVMTSTLNAEKLEAIAEAIVGNESLEGKDRKQIFTLIEEAAGLLYPDDIFGASVSQVGGESDEWVQQMDHGSDSIHVKAQRIGKPETGGLLKGAKAINRMNSVLGASVPVVVPLWGSGIKVVIAGIKITDVQSIVSRYNVKVGDLGWRTLGASFTADDMLRNVIIVDEILSKVVRSTLTDTTVENLKRVIKAVDIPVLIAGALKSLYRGGYPINPICRNVEQGKCSFDNPIQIDEKTGKFKTEQMVEFGRISVASRYRVTSDDLPMLNAPMNSKSVEEVLAHQKKMYKATVLGPLNDEGDALFSIVPRAATIAEYQAYSQQWINDCEMRVNDIVSKAGLTQPVHVEAMHNKNIVAISEIMKSGIENAWIEKIVINEDGIEEVISGDETVYKLLVSDFGMRYADEIRDHMLKYRESTVRAIVGIPEYTCPICQEAHTGPAHAPSIVPIDVASYFLAIGGWQLQQLELRGR